MSGAHWLAGVEDLLKADTGDLRQLAVLAGGDPATFYLGTPMDGADLRGQDLRGMLFTGLDPRKVRHDAKTIFPDGTRGGRLRRLRAWLARRSKDGGGEGG